MCLLHVEQERWRATCVAIFVPGEAQADGRGLLGKRSTKRKSVSLPQNKKRIQAMPGIDSAARNHEVDVQDIII